MQPKRNTWQREAVRAELGAVHGFLSAQDLHRRLKSDGSTVGLATVYRALGSLVESGDADAIQSPDGQTLFRSCATQGHHHHLVCRGCGETRELAATVVEEWANRVGAEHGYTEIGHVVDLFGLCPSCSAKR